MTHQTPEISIVMLKGVYEEKVVLPIHDAIAVKLEDAEWGAKTMHKAWGEVMGEDYCEVDIDYPDNFKPLAPLGP